MNIKIEQPLILEGSTFHTWMEKGIVRSCVKPGAVISLEDAKENTMNVAKLTKEVPAPLLVDIRKIKSINKAARDHFSMRGRSAGVTAIALWIKSPVSKLIGNFFMGLNKPTVPTRLFTSEVKAMNWLRQNFLQQHV